jgi:hypothetical protein
MGDKERGHQPRHPVGLKGNWYTHTWIEVRREIRIQDKQSVPRR